MRDMASTLYSTKDRHGISNISSYDSGVRRGCPFLDGNAERQEVAGESLNNKREVRGVIIIRKQQESIDKLVDAIAALSHNQRT